MGALEAFWHLLNFAYPAVSLGLIAAALAKLLWRRALAPVPWFQLARDSALVGLAVSIGGLVLFGHDGRMATYGSMVVACALTLWWRGFLARR